MNWKRIKDVENQLKMKIEEAEENLETKRWERQEKAFAD